MPQEYRRTTVAASPFVGVTKEAEFTTTNAYAGNEFTFLVNQEAADITVETADVFVQYRLNDGATWTVGDIVLKVGVYHKAIQLSGIRFRSRVLGVHAVVNLTTYTG